jgi:hypothetical protein
VTGLVDIVDPSILLAGRILVFKQLQTTARMARPSGGKPSRMFGQKFIVISTLERKRNGRPQKNLNIVYALS